nr:MFS transporter [Kibdelosporangium sp. MJ126-NF4]CEL22282.1 MFS transporter, DHA1 family [Kibdelosporangium sp. MJ126-NF4]CTQ93064.1 MFS transporter, DHA1 family [Kibdelosporangium sp. MJ126-NF4]
MTLRNYLLATGTFAAGTSAQVIAGVLPDLAASQQVSVATAGQLLTAFALTYAVGSPLLAALTGRWDRRTLLVAAMAVMALGNALAAVAPNYAFLFAARMFTALGAAVYTPTATVVAASLNPPERRARAFATVFGGLTVALVAGVPLSSALVSSLGYRGVFAVVAGLTAVATVAVWLVIPSVSPPEFASLRTRLALLGNRQILALLTVTLLISIAGLSVYTYLSSVLAEITGVTGGVLSLMLFAYGAGGVLGNWLGGRAAERFGTRVPLLCSLGLFVVSLALLPAAATSVAGAVVVLVLWGLANWSINPPMQTRLVDTAPESAGLTLALNASAIYLGIGLSGVTGGLVLALSGTVAMGPVAAVIASAALGVFVIASRGQSSLARWTTQSGPGNTNAS